MRATALGVVAYGAVQAGRRLEPGLAVEGRVDPRGDGGGVGDQVVVDVAQPELEPVLAGGDLVGGGEPLRRSAGPGISMKRGTSTSAARAAASIRRTLPTGSSASRTAISTAATSRPIRAAAPERAGELAGAAGDDDRQGCAEAADEREVGVAEDEAADQVGVPLARVATP